VRNSKTGERQVPLNADCVELLGELIGSRSAGPLWRRADPRGYQPWAKWVAIGCETAGVEPWTLKGLRHLACTRMLASGIDVATAASITGHTPAVLLATYAHVLEPRRQAAVAALARPFAQVIPFPQREVQSGS
jgi:integrase